MAQNPISLRVVIQQLGVYPVPNYRVIVYGDELKPMHSDFGSAADLSKALEAAVPGFHISQSLLKPLQEGQGSIVFEGEMILSSEQRSALGLKWSRSGIWERYGRCRSCSGTQVPTAFRLAGFIRKQIGMIRIFMSPPDTCHKLTVWLPRKVK